MRIYLPYYMPMYKRVRKLLDTFCFNPLSSGYKYLEEILLITTSENRHEYTSTGMLYAEVAKNHNVSPSSVGVAVRRAVERAWLRADFMLEYSLFGHTIMFKRGMPTCADFIANATQYLLINDRLK